MDLYSFRALNFICIEPKHRRRLNLRDTVQMFRARKEVNVWRLFLADGMKEEAEGSAEWEDEVTKHWTRQ